jgi:prevent-host-death family protein
MNYNSHVNVVKIANLKTHLSRYLDQARAGGEVVVYDRQTPIARIVPYAPSQVPRGPHPADGSEDSARLADLERRGVIGRRGDARGIARWAKTWLPKGSPRLSDTIRTLRDEEPW